MENKKQIAIVDYGAGNLFSVENALDFLQIPWIVTAAPQAIRDADGVILPGVGAFPDAMERLRSTGLEDTLREEAVKKPFLGICLGMQMLFETGFEFQQTRGLGLIPGTVEHLPDHYSENSPHGLEQPAYPPRLPSDPAAQRGGLCLLCPLHFVPTRMRSMSASPPSMARWCRPLSTEGQCTAPSSIRKRAGKWDSEYCAAFTVCSSIS